MTGIDANVLFAAFITILITVIAFFFKREREFATMQAQLKAAHKRIDRMERKQNGIKEALDE